MADLSIKMESNTDYGYSNQGATTDSPNDNHNDNHLNHYNNRNHRNGNARLEQNNYNQYSPTKYKLCPAGFLSYVPIIPFITLVGCLISTIIREPNRAFTDECNVITYIPSLSHVIGRFPPQPRIWEISTTLATLPRSFLPFILQRKYMTKYGVSDRTRLYSLIVTIATVTLQIENISLLVLSYFDSYKWGKVHEKAVITFLTSSAITNLAFLLLRQWRRDRLTYEEDEALELYKKFFFGFLISLGNLTFFYVRHVLYCDEYYYTYFALFEYICVVFNLLLGWMVNKDGFDGFDIVMEREKVD